MIHVLLCFQEVECTSRLRPFNGALRVCKESASPETFAFGIVDEAHHVFRTNVADDAATFLSAVDQLLSKTESWAICFDNGQAEAPWSQPDQLTCTLQLKEVVRNSRRIFDGCGTFRRDSSTSSNLTCVTGMTGSPLLPFVFPMCLDRAQRKIKYCSEIIAVLRQLIDDYPGLPLGGNSAILVQNSDWVEWLGEELEVESKYLGVRFVSAAEAQTSDAHDAITFDTVGNFDGMEALVIILVGLDSAAQDDVARCQIYRAISRAHCFVAVVQEFVSEGRLAFLAVTELEEREEDPSEGAECHSSEQPPSQDQEVLYQAESKQQSAHLPHSDASPQRLDSPEHKFNRYVLPELEPNTSLQLTSYVWQRNARTIPLAPQMLATLRVPTLCRQRWMSHSSSSGECADDPR